MSKEEKLALEQQIAINIIRKRGGKWTRRTPRRVTVVSAEDVIREIQSHPWYAISFNKNVTRVIVNLENVYGVVYEQIIFEYI
jgi:hypothetical protein